MSANKICAVPDCGRPHQSRSLCKMHAQRLRRTGTTDDPKRPTAEERFLGLIDYQPDGCWRWTAFVHTSYGYGQFTTGNTTHQAHRWAYEHFVGTVPAGLVLDHLCRNRACVNPAHLEPVTQAENLRRAPSALATINASKTACKHGHPLTPDNTAIKGGARSCRTCHRQNQAAYVARRRAV